MKARFIQICLLFFSCIAFAENIDFELPVGGFLKPWKETTSLTVEWNEKWFGEKASTVYNHGLARAACLFSYVAYADVRARPENNLLFDAYKKIGMKEADIETHYDIDYSDALWGNDQCAFSICSKKIQSSKGVQTLIFVNLRGTPMKASEWLSNLNVDDADKIQKTIHIGFAKAANIVHTALISYMLRHSINPTDAFLFMTGHSRGAAVANMLSSILLEDKFFKPENIYTYTFACPNVTTSDDSNGEKYAFIWNIVNAEDIVPTVPMNRGKWHFKKYGHVLAFVNQTNTDENLYRNEYVPRINTLYEKLSGRSYFPFSTGPFLPIVTTKLISYLTGDVEQYYGGAMNLHTRASKLMRKIFPDNEDDLKLEDMPQMAEESPENAPAKKKRISSWLLSWLNNKSNGLVDHIMTAAKDMHSDATYLAHIMALNENEVFSDVGYTLTIVRGYEELAVFNSERILLGRVIEGNIRYSDVKLPLALCPAIGNRVVIGYPSTEDFRVIVTDEALIPSPLDVTIEYYDAAGVYQRSAEPEKIYPSINRLFRFNVGKCLLADDFDGLHVSDIDNGYSVIEKVALRPPRKFVVVPEVSYGSKNMLSLGLHAGTSLFALSLMTRPAHLRFGKEGELDLGIGNQQTLYSRFKAENEIFAKFIWLNQDEKNFCFVPEYRTSISVKVIGRLRFFVAGTFDFCIKDFNDQAFGEDAWIKTWSSLTVNDSLSIVPGLQLGLRF